MSSSLRWSKDRVGPAALVAILVTFAVVAAWVRQPAITTGEDDAEYVLLSRAVRDFHYRDLADVSGGIHTRYPPAYPVALATAASVGGERVPTMALLGIAWALVTIVVLYAIARHDLGQFTALIACALVAVNPWFLANSGRLMSEAQFAALVTLTVWAGGRERRTVATDVLAGAGAIAASLTRVAGVPLLAALLIDWLIRRRVRSAIVFGAAALVTVGGWLVFAASAPDRYVGDSYIADAASIVGAGTRPGSASAPAPVATRAAAFLTRTIANARYYATEGLPHQLAVPTISGTVVDNLAWVVVLSVLIGIGLASSWRHSRLIVMFLAMYAALLVVWPWQIDRFLEPIVPLVVVSLLAGCVVLGRVVAPRLRFAVLIPLVGLIGVSSLRLDAATLRRSSMCDRSKPTTSAGCFDPVDRAFFAAARLAADKTPRTAVFLTPKEHTFHYYSGRLIFPMRRALALPPTTMLDSLRATRVQYTVVAPLGHIQSPYVERLRAICQSLAEVQRFSPDVVLFRVRASGEPPDSGACETLRTVRAVW